MSAVIEPIQEFRISDLLGNGDRYQIPIYQRNYAWGAKEIEQLIQDIIDYAAAHSAKNYYIGTLVVAAEHQVFQTVDGQQRLTTLFILSAVLKNTYPELDLQWLRQVPLHYASRNRAQLALNEVLAGDLGEDGDPAIRAAYDICIKALHNKLEEYEISASDFAKYLLNKVILLRVGLPQGIDLNHYFEIMNSRGEQLEKHEILKAELMECFQYLPTEERMTYEACFDLIWTACSNMEKYVQYGFSSDQRSHIFGRDDWNRLDVFNFQEFVHLVGPTLKQSQDSRSTIEEILAGKSFTRTSTSTDESQDRFNTVINFPNFLLHVLRIQVQDKRVSLDDKQLLELFQDELKRHTDKKAFVETFIYNLLKCRFLFDKYVIKREFTAGTDKWSLKQLRWYGKSRVGYVNTFNEDESVDSDNRRLIMLLAMFHVSIPSMPYKYWLNAALNFVFQQPEVIPARYIAYLEHIAKSLVFDRSLAKVPQEYFAMTYQNLHPIKRHPDDLDFGKLQYGRTDNLLFNFLDYLLWLRDKNGGLDSRIAAFEFTFRSSVEHYYPQNPLHADVKPLATEYLHAFGNLCLISHEKNSKLNNYSPTAKKDHYSKSAAIDSLKQFQMMQYPDWNQKEILAHGQEMQGLLVANLDSNFQMDVHESKAGRWLREYQAKDRITLLRAILGFADCTKYISGDKYQLFDYGHIRQHEAYQLFEEYIATHDPAEITDIIAYHQQREDLKPNWRYLFINNPEVMRYCEQGNFIWQAEGKMITLLKAGKRSLYGAQDTYLLLLAKFIKEAFNYHPYVDQEMLYLPIGIQQGQYQITKNREHAQMWLHIWNEDGISLNYELHATAHGNTFAMKRLKELNWVACSSNTFTVADNPRLTIMENDAYENLNLAYNGVIKLLEKGFEITKS